MAELSADELREMLAGTWLAMAAVAELLIQRRLVPRSELVSFLSGVEFCAVDRSRRSAIAAVRRLIESELGRDERFSPDWSRSEIVNQVFDEAMTHTRPIAQKTYPKW